MFLKSLPHSVSKASGKVPLRVILVIPFILQILGAVGLVGWLSLRNGQQAINDVTTQLRREITARIQQHLHHYLATPLLVNQINADAIRLGQLDVKDLTALERHFFWQAKRFPSVGYIYFGSKQGEFIGVERLDHVAELVIGLMLDEFHAPWVKISIAKVGIAKGVRRVGVQIERSRA